VSALKGGGASKEAAGFEDRWTVNKLFDLLAESALQIELEPLGTTPGTAENGFEFWLRRDGVREWHQVKYQNSDEGNWPLVDLKKRKVLSYFKDKLETEADAHCLFFSAHGAMPLEMLWERSQLSETYERFADHLLGRYEGDFADLRAAWGDLDEQRAWELLCRISTRNMDDRSLRESNRDRARSFVDAEDPDAVVERLTTLVGDRIHRRIDAEAIWTVLKEKGWGPRDWRLDPAVVEAIRVARTDFLRRQEERLINQHSTPISEVERVIKVIGAPAPSRPVVLHGPPGCGKSTAMMKAIRHFTEEGWHVLTLDLASVGAPRNAEEMGHALGLPAAPSDVLGNIVKDKRALLAIDGLDRIAFANNSPQELTAVLSEVLLTARSHERLSVLLSCRSAELEHDARVRSAVSRFGKSEERLALARWSQASVQAALVEAGVEPGELDEAQIELLRIPQNLYYLLASKDAGAFDFRSELDLQNRYTTHMEVGP
jgi:hypothetical protein